MATISSAETGVRVAAEAGDLEDVDVATEVAAGQLLLLSMLAVGSCIKHSAVMRSPPPVPRRLVHGRKTAGRGQLNAVLPGDLLHLTDQIPGR